MRPFYHSNRNIFDDLPRKDYIIEIPKKFFHLINYRPDGSTKPAPFCIINNQNMLEEVEQFSIYYFRFRSSRITLFVLKTVE